MTVEQGQDEIVIDAAASTIFALLQDSTMLPRWMPVVQTTTGKHQVAGAIRECEVCISGRRGRLREECSECVPNRRIAWRILSETVGFDLMIRDFQFSFDLLERGPRETQVVYRSMYVPKHALGRFMMKLIGQRKFRQVRVKTLANLKHVAEEMQITAGQQPAHCERVFDGSVSG